MIAVEEPAASLQLKLSERLVFAPDDFLARLFAEKGCFVAYSPEAGEEVFALDFGGVVKVFAHFFHRHYQRSVFVAAMVWLMNRVMSGFYF